MGEVTTFIVITVFSSILQYSVFNCLDIVVNRYLERREIEKDQRFKEENKSPGKPTNKKHY